MLPGTCYCRRGVEGLICERTESGRFFPALDFALVEAEGGAGNFTAVLPSEGHATAFTGSGYAQLSPGHIVRITNIRGPATFAYRLVMRYTLLEPCEVSPHSELTLEMHTDDPNSGFTAKVALDQLVRGVGQAWLVPAPVELLESTVYNFTLVFSGAANDSCSVLVDSFLAVPDVNQTRVAQMSDVAVKLELAECFRHRAALSLVKQEDAGCEGLVFSASTEVYNGTLGECYSRRRVDEEGQLGAGKSLKLKIHYFRLNEGSVEISTWATKFQARGKYTKARQKTLVTLMRSC